MQIESNLIMACTKTKKKYYVSIILARFDYAMQTWITSKTTDDCKPFFFCFLFVSRMRLTETWRWLRCRPCMTDNADIVSLRWIYSCWTWNHLNLSRCGRRFTRHWILRVKKIMIMKWELWNCVGNEWEMKFGCGIHASWVFRYLTSASYRLNPQFLEPCQQSLLKSAMPRSNPI